MASLLPDVDGDADVCCICLESLDADGLGRQRLPCGHVMHKLCVTELQRCGVSDRCPLCRQSHTELTSVQDRLDRAAVHYSRKEFRDAAELWTKVLDVDPENRAAAYNLGYCYRKGQGVPQDRDRAAELYEEARRMGSAHAACSLGVILKEKGDIHKAMELYEEALRGGDAEAACNLGNIHKEKGDISKATGLYEEARRRGIAVAAFNLGHIYRETGDIPKAIQLYEEALRGGSAKAGYNLGLLYQQKRNIPEAMEAYEVARRGGVARAALNIGNLYQERGDIPQAMALFEEALHGEPALAAFNLGSIHLRRGDLPKATELLTQAYQSGGAEVRRRVIAFGVLTNPVMSGGFRGDGASQQHSALFPNASGNQDPMPCSHGATSSGAASSSSGLGASGRHGAGSF